jgi:hypothetical protein
MAVLGVLCAAGGKAGGQAPPDYGFEWRTIGAVGNAAASPTDFPGLAAGGWGPIGRVDHAYRMARTEVTVGQYLEFVNAYAPCYTGSINDIAFTGIHIYSSTGDPADPRFVAEPGSRNWPTDMSWFMAARLCNWLTNAKGTQRSAFESGAYDMGTYVLGSDHYWRGQVAHSSGALFWIPSLDEWTKGMHYDPNKNGPGQGGYWLYPTSSDSPPVGGPPGTPGAQTSAGDYPSPPDNPFRFYDVGSYPNTQSPWGLLDGSGGVGEMLEPRGSPFFSVPGRGTGSASRIFLWDQLDQVGGGSPTGTGGLRLASVVPAPSVVGFVILTFMTRAPRRRR